MTNEQKKELINTNPVKAFKKWINSDNYYDYIIYMYVAEYTLDINKCYSTNNILKAQKATLLFMLDKNLL